MALVWWWLLYEKSYHRCWPASLCPQTLFHMLSSFCTCIDPWKKAQVIKNKRCSQSLWQGKNMRRKEAQAKCYSDSKCLGLMWLNNAGANRVSKYHLQFGSDSRLVYEGYYQGCYGEIATETNNDWDVIVKPGQQATTRSLRLSSISDWVSRNRQTRERFCLTLFYVCVHVCICLLVYVWVYARVC